MNSGDDAEEGEAGGGRREGGSLPNGGVGSAGGGGGGSRLRTVVLPLLLRASFSHRCVSFLFSSLSNSASLCFSVLLYYLLVAVATTGTADGGSETRWQLL